MEPDISPDLLKQDLVIHIANTIRYALSHDGSFQKYISTEAREIWEIALEMFRKAGYRVEVKKCKERRLYSESRNSLAITVKFPHIEQEAPTPHD